jgi:hypothetical protein
MVLVFVLIKTAAAMDDAVAAVVSSIVNSATARLHERRFCGYGRTVKFRTIPIIKFFDHNSATGVKDR